MNYGGSRPTQEIPSENNVYWFKEKKLLEIISFLLLAITHHCGLMWIFWEVSSEVWTNRIRVLKLNIGSIA